MTARGRRCEKSPGDGEANRVMDPMTGREVGGAAVRWGKGGAGEDAVVFGNSFSEDETQTNRKRNSIERDVRQASMGDVIRRQRRRRKCDFLINEMNFILRHRPRFPFH